MSRRGVQELSERIDVLLDEVQRKAEPEVTEKVEDLIRAVLSLQGAGLAQILTRLRAEPDGDGLVRRLVEDNLVSGMLLLHDLHPDDVATRIQAALDGVRPYLGSHAGGIDYLGLDDDGVVHLRLQGSCEGCPGSTATVQLTVENAVLDAAPEAVAVDVEGMIAQKKQTLLTIEPFRPREETEGWHRLAPTASPGRMVRTEVAGLELLIANLGGTFYAYRDSCPACGSALHAGTLDGDRLTCPGCPTSYDVRLAGRPLPPATAALEPLPLLPDGTAWKIAVPGRQPA